MRSLNKLWIILKTKNRTKRGGGFFDTLKKSIGIGNKDSGGKPSVVLDESGFRNKIEKKSRSNLEDKRRGAGDFIGIHPTKWDYGNNSTSNMRMTNILNTLLTEENFENITEKILAGTTLKEAKDTRDKNGGNKVAR